MRALTFAAAVAVLPLALLGCPPKHAGGDGGSDATAPSASASAAVEAGPAKIANADQVTTYPDQRDVDHVPLTVKWSVANVRAQAGTGGVIVSLKRGTDVDEVAEKGDYVLVVFDDPNNPSRRLEGWTGKAVFAAERVVVDAGVDAGAVAALDAGGGGGGAPQPFKIMPNKDDSCPGGYTKNGVAKHDGVTGWCRLRCGTTSDCRGDDSASCTEGMCFHKGEHL